MSSRTLIVDLFYGANNRIRAYISCKILARITKRKLIIKWSLDSNMSASFEELFKLHVDQIDELPPGNIFNFVKFPFDSQSKFFKELKSDKPIVICKNMIQLCPFVDPKGIQFRKELQKMHRSLTDPIMHKVDFLRRKINLQLDERLVGIHFRDWTPEMGDSHVQKILEEKSESKDLKITKLIEYMSEAKKEFPKTKFFIASDSKEIISQIKSIRRFKVYSNTLKSINRKTSEDVMEAMAEWYILGICEYLIGTAGSSFSQVASMLTKQQRMLQIGLNPWTPV